STGQSPIGGGLVNPSLAAARLPWQSQRRSTAVGSGPTLRAPRSPSVLLPAGRMLGPTKSAACHPQGSVFPPAEAHQLPPGCGPTSGAPCPSGNARRLTTAAAGELAVHTCGPRSAWRDRG